MEEEVEGEFEKYVSASSGRLLKLAYLLTANLADAEDLLQETLTRVFMAWPLVRRAASVDAYVRRVMVNANRRRFRRRRVSEVLDGKLHEARDSHQAAAAIEDRHNLAEGLADLPRGQRHVVVLRYYEDLSEHDVAALLGCSVGTVKSQAAKAMAKLRTHRSIESVWERSPNRVSHA